MSIIDHLDEVIDKQREEIDSLRTQLTTLEAQLAEARKQRGDSELDWNAKLTTLEKHNAELLEANKSNVSVNMNLAGKLVDMEAQLGEAREVIEWADCYCEEASPENGLVESIVCERCEFLSRTPRLFKQARRGDGEPR